MPRENQKRGRRAEAQKRKREELEDAQDSLDSPKRRRTAQDEEQNDRPEQENGSSAYNAEATEPQTTFYGLLDQQEQDYFKSAEEMLDANQFADQEERRLFLANVHTEATGKGLKMACSQSCSRLLEKLIHLSTPDQLKKLFQQFNGHFLNLTQHRFASHCCESLFIKSAPIVTQEITAPDSAQDLNTSADEPIVSMENLFLFTINEFDDSFGYLMTHRHASHTLRVLLLILAGRNVEEDSPKSALRSKRKEGVSVGILDKPKTTSTENRAVPQSFTTALEKVVQDALQGIDTNQIRSLATHESANPVLQLMLQCELATFGKQRAKEDASILKRLLPDEPLTSDTESAAFLNGILRDPVGSRLYETIIKFAPGKLFKSLYRELFKGFTASLAKQDLAAYVAATVLERLGRDDLQGELQDIARQVPELVQKNRLHFLRTTIERCVARDVEIDSLVESISQVFSDEGGSLSLYTMLGLPRGETSVTDALSAPPSSVESGSTSHTGPNDWPSEPLKSTPQAIQASLLGQTMLTFPGPTSELMFNALTQVDAASVLLMARTPHLAPVLTTALTASHAPIIFRRKLITRFYGHTVALSQDVSGSRVIDTVWKGTLHGLAFARERIAEELAEEEATMRGSKCGRAVWRNWHMELYKRRRGEWVRRVREEAGNDGFLSFPDATDSSASPKSIETMSSKGAGGRDAWHSSPRTTSSIPHQQRSGGKAKTPLDLAREKFAAKSVNRV